jgi:RNA recognition motif-containing protein
MLTVINRRREDEAGDEDDGVVGFEFPDPELLILNKWSPGFESIHGKNLSIRQFLIDKPLFENQGSAKRIKVESIIYDKSNLKNSTSSYFFSSTVFIGRIPFDLSQQDYKKCMEEIGCVHSFLCLNKIGKSKGFGFAKFHNFFEAVRAVHFLNGRHDFFPGQNLILRVELSKETI